MQGTAGAFTPFVFVVGNPRGYTVHPIPNAKEAAVRKTLVVAVVFSLFVPLTEHRL